MSPTAAIPAPMALIRYLSPPHSLALAKSSDARIPPPPLLRRPAPGRRLISIIGRLLVLAEGEADRQHQQRRDFIGHQRLESALAHLDVGERVGELDRLLRSAGER